MREKGVERGRVARWYVGVNNRPANFIGNLCVSNSEIEMRIIRSGRAMVPLLLAYHVYLF